MSYEKESAEMDLISVIVPVYNVEPYLERCVNSIRRQTYENLEIILVDDGSPDLCGQMCDDYARMDARIKVVHKENGGQGFARNSGLEIASGVYVAFVDSDDWIGETRIENLYLEAKKTQADMVIGGHTSVSRSGILRKHSTALPKKDYKGINDVRELVLDMIAPAPEYPQDVIVESGVCMNLYNRGVIQKNGLRFVSERETVAEDLHFNMEYLCYSNHVVVIEETNYFYFENQQSHTRRFDLDRIFRTIRFYHAMLERAGRFGIADICQCRIDRCYLMKVRVVFRLIVQSSLLQKEKIQKIKYLLQEEVTKEVIHRYPIRKYIPAMRLLVWLMKKQNALGVYYLMVMREGIGRRGICKKLLQSAGIGR